MVGTEVNESAKSHLPKKRVNRLYLRLKNAFYLKKKSINSVVRNIRRKMNVLKLLIVDNVWSRIQVWGAGLLLRQL